MEYMINKQRTNIVLSHPNANIRYWLVTVQKDKLDENGQPVYSKEGCVAHIAQQTFRIYPHQKGRNITLDVIKHDALDMGLRICVITPVFYDRDDAGNASIINLISDVMREE